MAALVQSYPQQSGTITMLQTRPTSATGILPVGQSQGQQYGINQSQRNSFYGTGGQGGYRGSSGPIQPYAFTSTPSLHPNSHPWQHSAGMRSSSATAVPNVHSFDAANHVYSGRSLYPASASMSHLPSSFSAGGYVAVGSRDDSSLPPPAVGGRRVAAAPRPQSAYITGGSTTATATQVTFTQASPVKVSPERYRRPVPRAIDPVGPSPQPRPQISSAQSAGPGLASPGNLYVGGGPEQQRPVLIGSRTSSSNNSRPNSMYSSSATPSVDDIQLSRQQPQDDNVKRLRRRSMPALDSADYTKPLSLHDLKQPEVASGPGQLQLDAAANGDGNGAAAAKINHTRNDSSESLVSSHGSVSGPSSAANRHPTVSAPTANPAASTSLSGPDQTSSANQDYPRLVNIPPRSSSSDASKTSLVPSPLSRPMTMESEVESASKQVDVALPIPSPIGTPGSPPVSQQSNSPAVQQLAAISQRKGKPRSKTSRLRRAFSFGSSAEFRKASIPEDSAVDNVQDNTPTKLQKDPSSDDLYDAEQARIAEQQEAAGIGHNIYAGKMFAASTDNVSISSTASSASIMIRKMGRGMKKGTRSLVGLFRPKSTIGAPSAEAQPSETCLATVSMITVEAERERVNVNSDPHTQNGGGTGFPRLERNSIDASKSGSTGSERLGSSDTDSSGARRSIVGGDKERAEVLAAVRKGILKNRGASRSPPGGQASVVVLPSVPAMSESPNSSAPSTPNDEVQGHKRSGSVAIGSEDYFMTALRLRQETRSAPVTPQMGTPTGTLRRNATFSPRIVFYDTWPSQEYDRRSEISTCNRLTPMLAQQIKEELNTFKMEMEVHETSKIYTQFF